MQREYVIKEWTDVKHNILFDCDIVYKLSLMLKFLIEWGTMPKVQIKRQFKICFASQRIAIDA